MYSSRWTLRDDEFADRLQGDGAVTAAVEFSSLTLRYVRAHYVPRSRARCHVELQNDLYYTLLPLGNVLLPISNTLSLEGVPRDPGLLGVPGLDVLVESLLENISASRLRECLNCDSESRLHATRRDHGLSLVSKYTVTINYLQRIERKDLRSKRIRERKAEKARERAIFTSIQYQSSVLQETVRGERKERKRERNNAKSTKAKSVLARKCWQEAKGVTSLCGLITGISGLLIFTTRTHLRVDTRMSHNMAHQLCRNERSRLALAKYTRA